MTCVERQVNAIGAGTIQIEANSPFSGTTNVNAGIFRVIQGVDYGSDSATFNVARDSSGYGTLAGGGTILANNISVRGHLSPDNITDNDSKYGTLTLQAGNSISMNGFSMDFDITIPTDVDWDWGTQTGDQDLLVIEGPQVQNFKGTINFLKNAGFRNGTYLVIRSDNGFAGQDGKQLTQDELDGINNPDGVLKATLNGYDIHTSSATPRQTVGYSYGNNGADKNTIWLNNSLNSLTMDWTAGTNYWDSGERMLSLQTWGTDNDREKHFLSGDKVHISNINTGAGNEITVTLESADGTAMTPVVSGLVVGKDSGTDGTDGTPSNGDVVITGKGGITADISTPFGVYVYDTLIPTGKLEKFGTGTLTFDNIGGNLFESGIDLYGGTTAFNIANQLNVGTDKAITFKDDGINRGATLQPNASAILTTLIIVENGATGTFHVDKYDDGEDIGLFLNGNVHGPGNVVKTGEGVLQFAKNDAGTNTVSLITNTDVKAGKFRVAQGMEYGSTGTFTLDKGAELSGGGTVEAGDFNIRGKIAADKTVMTPTKMDVTGDDRIATLTLKGITGTPVAAFYSDIEGTERVGFNFDYRVTATNDPSDPDVVDNTENDLLSLQGMSAVKMEGGVINFMTDKGSLTTGKYLIIDSNVAIKDVDGNDFVPAGSGDGMTTFEIDGINRDEGVMWGKINGEDIRAGGPRGEFKFELLTGNATNSQLWLDVTHNTLETIWQGGNGNWSTGGWESVQHTNPSGTEELYDYNFFDGDLVYFKDMAVPDNYTVTVDRDVIASGVDVSTTQNITFDGKEGIKTILDDDPADSTDYINGRYVVVPPDAPDPNPMYQQFNTTGKLVKRGSGTLTLANTGDNEFQEGIDIYGSTISLAGTEENRLGKYTSTTGNAGQVTFKNNTSNGTDPDPDPKAVVVNKIDADETGQTLQNRFVVERNVTGAKITANVDTTISGVTASDTVGRKRLRRESSLDGKRSVGHLNLPNPLA